MRCVALLLCCGVLLAQSDKPAADVILHGVVKDSGGAPVSDVLLSVTQATMEIMNGRSVTVRIGAPSVDPDEEGKYAFAGLRAGTYTVRVTRDRQVIATKEVQLESDKETTLDFVIPQKPTISGRVVNQDDEPAVDAFVWLLRAEYQTGALKQTAIGPKVTGEDGAFTFDSELEPNRKYYLLVDVSPPEEVVSADIATLQGRAPIEVPTFYPAATRMEAATPIILLPGERREQVEIKVARAPFYCVDGKIQVAGAPSSSLFSIQDEALAGSKLTRLRSAAGEDGAYHACGLSSGAYRLVVDGAYVDFTVSGGDAHRVNLATDPAQLRLQLEWDPESTHPKPVDFKTAESEFLHKLAAFMGNQSPTEDELQALVKRGQEGDPEVQAALGNPELLALQGRLAARSERAQASITGPTGTNTFATGQIPSETPFQPSVSPGNYALAISFYGPEDAYPKEVTYDGIKVTDGMVRIAPGANSVIRVVVAQGTAGVTVKATDRDGKPVPDATVILIPDYVLSVAALSGIHTFGQANQQGSFTFERLSPGKYKLLAISTPIRWGLPDDLENVALSENS